MKTYIITFERTFPEKCQQRTERVTKAQQASGWLAIGKFAEGLERDFGAVILGIEAMR